MVADALEGADVVLKRPLATTWELIEAPFPVVTDASVVRPMAAGARTKIAVGCAISDTTLLVAMPALSSTVLVVAPLAMPSIAGEGMLMLGVGG